MKLCINCDHPDLCHARLSAQSWKCNRLHKNFECKCAQFTERPEEVGPPSFDFVLQPGTNPIDEMMRILNDQADAARRKDWDGKLTD